MFANAFVITWRESLEALLVVGILMAWAVTQPEPGRYRKAVLSGVGGGLACAAIVAAAAMGAREMLTGDTLDIVQIVMLFATWGLITQMLLWMHRHAGSIGEALRRQATEAGTVWGVALVAGLAVAREGIETVMFLFGFFLQAHGTAVLALVAGMLAGLVLACAVAALAVRGSRYMRMRWVFLVSEILLLGVACSMLATGVDRVLSRDWLSALADPLWDMSGWLDDTTGMGGLLASFVGYRAEPSGLWGLCFTAYALYVVWMFWPRRSGERR